MRRSGALWVYVAAVDLAAVAAFVVFPAGELLERAGLLALLAALSALTGTRPVRFPAFSVQLTVSHPFVICAVAVLGPLGAALTSVAPVLTTWLRPGHRPAFIRQAFNLGAQALSAAAAGWIFLLLGGRPGLGLAAMLGPLAASTAVYFMGNTGLVAAAVSIEKRRSLIAIWRDSFVWTIVSYLAGLTLAACMLLILQTLGMWGLALAVPPCWLLLAFYRTHRERLEEHRRRIDEVEELNAELEAKVAERTRELKDALGRIEGANRQLRDTNTRLVEASRAKSAFLANVSHELRTPLNAIIGFSDLLSQREVGPLTERQRELLADIEDSGEHLLSLINDILDLSKVEAGKMEIHRSVVEIPDLVRRCAAMVRPQAEKKGLTLDARCETDVRLANVDPGMFRGALINLLGNAVKFTPESGKVGVDVRRAGDDLLVEVSDTGIGIAEEDQGRVFQEFQQVDGSYTREHQGTGLGLALVRRMVELHEGSVSLESELGRGSRFRCLYPGCLIEATDAAESPEPARAEPLPAAPVEVPRSPGNAILLADGRALDRQLARNVLRSRGYRVAEADSGAAVLDRLREERPDLVLIDLELAGPVATDVAAGIRNDPTTARIPLVALGAIPEGLTEVGLHELGFAGWIGKPIKLSRFPAQIAAFLEAEENVA